MTDLELYFENENILNQYVDKIKLLSQQDITKIANKYFNEKDYATAISTPKNCSTTQDRAQNLNQTKAHSGRY